MQLHPTRSAVDLTVAGIAMVALGVVVNQGTIVAWAGALVLGLQIARAVTLLGVAKVRASGFEMIWQEERRVARIARGEIIELRAEVRNRDTRAARYVNLRALHAPQLDLKIDPAAGEVPAGGRLAVTISVSGARTGRHGIYGLSLEVRGSPGLYEVPLTFSNPFGIEVMPRVYSTRTRSAQGGRSRSRTEGGRVGPKAGGHYDLREIREYMPGDPFRRIAWKASGRRGQLMVREFDLEERDLVWLVLDASVELWSGVYGQAPLDLAIDEVASLSEFHLGRGAKVGLAIVAARRLSWIKPDSGAAHAAHLMEALAFNTACHDADRSAFDETDVAVRVLEHVRPLEPAFEGVRARQIDRVARRASAALRRAPFSAPPPFAATPREKLLRQYLLNFGISSPARLEPDRPKTDGTLSAALKEILTDRPRPSLVYVWSPSPSPSQAALLDGLASLPRRHNQLRWVPLTIDTGFESDHKSALGEVVRYAVSARALVAKRQGEVVLRKLSIRTEHPVPPARSREPNPQTDEVPHDSRIS